MAYNEQRSAIGSSARSLSADAIVTALAKEFAEFMFLAYPEQAHELMTVVFQQLAFEHLLSMSIERDRDGSLGRAA